MSNALSLVSGNINSLSAFIEKLGFKLYGSFNETEPSEVPIQHDIYTCIKGKYSGDVIDVYYNYNTGQIHHKEVSSQFKGSEPMFSFN